MDGWIPAEYRGNLVTLPVFDELGPLVGDLDELWTNLNQGIAV